MGELTSSDLKPLPVLARVNHEHDGFGCDTDLLVCPACDGGYARSGRVVHVNGGDDYTAWDGRGDAIAIAMHGECGHSWTLCLGLHKGRTFMFTSRPLVEGQPA